MSDRPDGSPTAVDVVLRPEWAAVQAKDKVFTFRWVVLAPGVGLYLLYVVPAGKTLYIVEIGEAMYAQDAADAELNQMFSGYIYEHTTQGTLWRMGGNGGAGAVFNKPLVIPAGHQVDFGLTNQSNHHVLADMAAGGYEV